MLNIDRSLITYKCELTNREVKHYVLIVHQDERKILLSYANLFLYKKTSLSVSTSNRYSNILSKFYRFLSNQDKFHSIDCSQYHAIVDNNDIKRWQIQRQEDRVTSQKLFPTLATIFEEAKILLTYFKWLHDCGINSNVKIELVTWKANFKDLSLLNYVNKKEKKTISSKGIQILEKEVRQKVVHTLISNKEIKLFIESFSDPVYAALFKLSLGTAMRPMDLCKFPYLGRGANKHIMPYSSMDQGAPTCKYTVHNSKGKKTRKIVINMADLKILEDYYIRPYYFERVAKYEKKYGKKCPPSILFLNSNGDPVTPAKISSRSNDAKKRAITLDSSFREGVSFYDARHWWPTMFLIRTYKDELLTAAADVIMTAAAQVLTEQMGHEHIETTFKYYIDKARILTLANKGYVNDIVTNQDESVEEFIERIDSRKPVE